MLWMWLSFKVPFSFFLNKHKDFNVKNARNDIALLKLWEDVELNDHVQVACLPKKQSFTYPSPTKKAMFAGWGRNETNSSEFCTAHELKNMRAHIYDPADPLKRCNFSNAEWNTMICAGRLNRMYSKRSFSSFENTFSGKIGKSLILNSFATFFRKVI